MKKSGPALWVIILITAFNSCQVIYDDPSIQSDKIILTVQGRLSNGSRPYYVKLANAVPFNAQYSTLARDIAVKGAKVVIEDNAGNTEMLTEQSNGLYATSETGIQGIAGRIYTLSIVTKEGDIYKSSPCLLNASLPIDSIYYEAASDQTLSTTTSGLASENGVNIYADLSPIKSQPVYCKFETRIIRELFAYEYPDGPHEPQINIYAWTVGHLEEVPALNANVTPGNNLIKKQPLGFLAKDKMSDNPVAYADYTMMGRIISCYSYSISEEAYLYYSHLHDQLTAVNQLFDPISTNLTGNIKCENNPSKKVFGLFEVSGKSAKHSFLRYNQSDMLIHCKNVTDVPENVVNGVMRDHPPVYDTIPVFWQQF